jgi:transcriptional regulator with XRE-family HTH domain
MARAAELGEFLRSRRARVRPDRVGLDFGSRRRVPGLRREEVAQLAHVSADYVVRLEQGRVGRPSAEIVDALARALLLDDAERHHLFLLASASELPSGRGDGTEVRPELALVVQSLDPSPAVLLSRRLDLLVWNATAGALLGPFGHERNYARLVLTDPVTRRLHVDWEDAARQAVAILRWSATRHPDDAVLHALIDELRAASSEAAQWWSAHDVTEKRSGVKRYRHPQVGELALHFEALVLPDDGDQLLTIYAAAPGTVDADRLAQLTHLAATAGCPER